MDEDEFRKTLENFEIRISDLEEILKSKPKILQSDGYAVVADLISSGFFDDKKKLSDVTKELKIQAKFNKNHKYTKILETLTREDKLMRKMSGHQWWYTKND